MSYCYACSNIKGALTHLDFAAAVADPKIGRIVNDKKKILQAKRGARPSMDIYEGMWEIVCASSELSVCF